MQLKCSGSYGSLEKKKKKIKKKNKKKYGSLDIAFTSQVYGRGHGRGRAHVLITLVILLAYLKIIK